MDIQKMSCPSCGAPLQISTGTETINCPSCSTQLAVTRDQSIATLEAAELLGNVVQQTENVTQSVIRNGTEVTQSELKRLQINHDISMLQLQLSNTQSEMRSLQRVKKDRITKRQIKELRIREGDLRQQIQHLQTALLPLKPKPHNPGASVQQLNQNGKNSSTKLQKEKKERKPVSGTTLIVFGVPVFLFGCLVSLLFTVAQITHEAGEMDNIEGFFMFQALCILPVILMGVVLLVFGYIRLRKQKEKKGSGILSGSADNDQADQQKPKVNDTSM